jgi:thioesterase domain-containing protein
MTFDQVIDQMRAVCLAAFRNYVPRRYDGKFLSIRACGGDPFDLMMSKGSGGWEQATGQPVAIRKIAGNHSTLLRLPHVTELAKIVDAQLADCD